MGKLFLGSAIDSMHHGAPVAASPKRLACTAQSLQRRIMMGKLFLGSAIDSMHHGDELAIYCVHVRPAVFDITGPSLCVGNCELPSLARPVPIFAFHQMRVEAIAWLHLAEHDVALVYLLVAGHWLVCASVVVVDPRPQRPSSTSVTRPLSLQQLLFYHGIPQPSPLELRSPIFRTQRPIDVEVGTGTNLVLVFQHERRWSRGGRDWWNDWC